MSTNAPPVAAALEPALRAILGDALTPADTAHAVDGLAPALVATSPSTEQLAAVLALADEHGAAVIPWGGGTHMSLGNPPDRYDIALRTTKLDRVLEYEPADLTVTVEAGVTFGRLQALLRERGQFLPIDAPTEATIGGVLATGLSGPSAHAYGLPRDWLLGCRLALADGTIVKGGGRVVKNVAGYDLPKLAVGSLGTLGVIVEATFKVAPLPPAQETLLHTFPTPEAAAALAFAADERGLALRALALRHAEGKALAVCWLAGPAAAVERTARELAALARDAGTERLKGEGSERWWAELTTGEPTIGGVALRASLPPSGVAGFMAALEREAGVLATTAYPTTGIVLAQLGDATVERRIEAIERARQRAADAGGSLVVTSAPATVKEHIDVWGDPGSALPLMRRLKQQFDPKGTLNPGRFVSGI